MRTDFAFPSLAKVLRKEGRGNAEKGDPGLSPSSAQQEWSWSTFLQLRKADEGRFLEGAPMPLAVTVGDRQSCFHYWASLLLGREEEERTAADSPGLSLAAPHH
jgi:hypothetical protein